MRECKFRYVWRDKKFNIVETEIYTLAEIFHGKAKDRMEVEDWIIHSIDEYTGIKDKNGVEIYEWDVLQNDDFGGKLCYVAFGNGYFSMIHPETVKDEYSMHTSLRDGKDVVIGNIYENPELLEDGNGNNTSR